MLSSTFSIGCEVYGSKMNWFAVRTPRQASESVETRPYPLAAIAAPAAVEHGL
jgi:hypothetical protein